ncbi:MAG: Z1 domain-containing protein [Suilimivivens sp.]
MNMTEIQKNIVGKVLMDASVMTIPITEEWIIMMVNSYEMQGKLLGTPVLTDAEKEEVITTLHASLFVRIDRGHCLKEKDHTPWYMAAKAELPSNFWDRYRIYLQKEKHWNKDTVNELDKTTDEIMDLLGNPDSANSFLYRGLCIGDVQSGKTSTYIGLINKAADAHYRVIILLTGTIEKLRRQTQQRIDEGFIGLDSYAFTLEKDSVQVGVGSIDPNTSGWAVTSTTSDFNAATAKKIVGQLSNINAPVIFVLKKNKSVLEKLEHWLRFYNANKTTKKIDLPMLLIDDEADNASVNAKKDDEVTAINKGIRKLLVLFEKANYVGFTATPYANIFIDPDTEQEMLEHDLFPRDFIYALEAPSNYIGARSIFGNDAPYGYMLESNDDCESVLPLKHKKEDVLTYMPKSMEEAITAFFICNAVRDLRGDTKSHRTMMINISRFIAVQNQITRVVDSYVRDAKREIRNYYLTGVEALQYDIFKLMKQVYEKYFAGFASDPEYSDLKHFTWEQIQEAMYPAISRIEVRTINGGNAPKNLDYENYEKKPNDIGLRLIAVGGLSLSRGLTLEGLSTSYFYRNSSMYDTLMQMGRWFGYRGKYRDLCKIWMPDESMAWYSYISMATDKLRAEVRRMQNDNMTPTDFGLAVRSDIQGLLVTARNKMRTAKDYETVVNFSGEVVETRYVYSSKEILQRNYEETELFLNDLATSYSVHRNDPDLALKSYQYLNVAKEKIVDFLSVYSAHTLNIDFSITELLSMFSEDDQQIFDYWDVLIASGLSTTPAIEFANLMLPPVKRNFAYRKDTKSLQMSGKNSRLGSKDLAKGGLTKATVAKMEADKEDGKSFNEEFYFNTGMKRNPLMVIYPVKLAPKETDSEYETKKKIADSIDFPIVGVSIGIPRISGKKREVIKYKINKQKWLELFGADDVEDFDEVDETIQEE